MGQESRSGFAGWFWLEISQEAAVRCQLGLQSSKGLTGVKFQDGALIWDGELALGDGWRPHFLTTHTSP